LHVRVAPPCLVLADLALDGGQQASEIVLHHVVVRAARAWPRRRAPRRWSPRPAPGAAPRLRGAREAQGLESG
jgi:hypothetical protein